jgi:Zn-dependent M28 family amino/carboxypeptidase
MSFNPSPRFLTVCFFSCFALSAADTVPPDVRSALNVIQANELKGDLSFLASDLLQGRYTPSPGLDIAAEFIASKFRAAGLEPVANGGYFQLAEMVVRHPAAGSALTAKTAEGTINVPAEFVHPGNVSAPAHIADAPIVVFAKLDPDLLKNADVAGKAVVVPALEQISRATVLAMRAFNRALIPLKPAIEIMVNNKKQPQPADRLLFAEDAAQPSLALLNVNSKELLDWVHHNSHGAAGATLSVDVAAPDDQKVTVKNVIGILRGSDLALKDSCVLLTAHYDHIGTTQTAGNSAVPAPQTDDHIFNGANDDGSGTVSVIEVARALAHLNPHPKRSIVFMTFFGEERGEFGSQFYGRHPVFPIAKTVADINLEQVGRTDATTGKQIKTASLTGYDYSEVTEFLEKAGKQTGIKVYKDDEASDAYFTRSDNAALAEQGVPAHSLTVAFDYPDYHRVGDEWQKIDYDNMAAVDRMVALALVNIANTSRAPAWNTDNPKTEPFRQAQKNLATP